MPNTAFTSAFFLNNSLIRARGGLHQPRINRNLAILAHDLQASPALAKAQDIQLCISGAGVRLFPVSKQLERVKSLIVDDNPHMRKLVATVLESYGEKEILHAENTSQAHELCQSAKPDLIILDMMFPGQPDGIAFAHDLRNNPDSPCPFVPIIMLTAYPGLDNVRAARDAGINEFLTKPITAGALYTRIYAVIETPRPFVRTQSYFGPDRRRTRKTEYTGPERRESGAKAAPRSAA